MTFVVTLQQDGEGYLIGSLSRSEIRHKDADKTFRIPLNVDALPKFDTREHAECYGRTLQEALAEHPAIKEALTRLYQTPAGTSASLHFEIKVPSAEAYRWEGLCHDEHGFAVVNLGAHVARVASYATAVETAPRILSWPVKIAAFLSAAGNPAEAEAYALIGAVQKARKEDFDSTLQLFLGERDLIEEIEEKVAAGTIEGVEVSPMPAEPTDFESVIKDTAPDVIHFFCHGVSRAGLQHIEFATVADWDRDDGVGTALLSIQRLTKMEALKHSWLVVLNCCEGASAFEQAHSMAYAMVAEGGCPAAVGMNEPIQWVDATAFAKVFYDKLLLECLKPPLETLEKGDEVEAKLDLSPAINAARMTLYEKYSLDPPEAFGRWSLPILYMSEDSLRIIRGAAHCDVVANRELEQKAELLAKTLRELPQSAPQEFRQQIHDILTMPPVVPESMRPDLHGNFRREP